MFLDLKNGILTFSGASIKQYFIEYKYRIKLTSSLDFWTFCQRAFLLSVFFNLPNYIWYIGIGWSSAAAITAIFNTSCFFAYLFSVWLLKESWSFMKLSSVALALTGVILISLVDRMQVASNDPHKDSSLAIVGDLLTFLGAIMYGAYEVMYKKYAGFSGKNLGSATNYALARMNRMTGTSNEMQSSFYGGDYIDESAYKYFSTHSSMALFLANQYTAWIGVSTFLIQWIVIIPLHFTGFEPFELPPSALDAFYLCLNALMSFLYNSLFLLSIALTSPVFAAVGVILTIPSTAIVDFLVRGEHFGPWGLIGTFSICTAFLILAWSERKRSSDLLHNLRGDQSDEDEEEKLDSITPLNDSGLFPVTILENSH